MRVLGILVLLVAGLGFGIATELAAAEPCPLHAHHAHHGAMAGQQTEGAGSAMVPATPVETVAIAAPAQPDATPASPPVSDHAVPEGQSCCHAAATATLSVVPVLAPRVAARLAVPRSWLPPRLAPTTDIYRPPASA
jgi:hypothetical protein